MRGIHGYQNAAFYEGAIYWKEHYGILIWKAFIVMVWHECFIFPKGEGRVVMEIWGSCRIVSWTDTWSHVSIHWLLWVCVQ